MRTEQRVQRINDVVTNRQQGIVVLEDIHDPHNAQAVFRSCDCFGIQQVYVIFEQEKQFNPTKMGKLASSSANKWLDYKVFDSTVSCIEELRQQDYEIIATTLDDKAESIFEAEFTGKQLAICLGNEHRGLSDTLIKAADRLITIPMSGMIQSLNLSVTAALILYEINRQRRQQGIEDYSLDNDRREQLMQSLLER